MDGPTLLLRVLRLLVGSGLRGGQEDLTGMLHHVGGAGWLAPPSTYLPPACPGIIY